jgi:hypothetical protein
VGAEFALGVMRGVMLHDFLLVSMTLLCLFALARQWRWRLAVSAAFLLLAVHLLQCCKMEFRQSAWFGRGEPVSIGRVMVSMVTAPEQIFQRERISATVARLNQGKIVEAISNHVPEVQSFAHGTTLWEAVHASLVPRLFDPSKPRGTDSERFARYTGHVLDTSTAMNLGILGEGYANFGPFGAVCTLFAYGLIFGLAYRYVLKRAACCPLWWVWFAYVFYWWPKTEGGIAASLNFTTKAALIFLAVVFISPAWRHALGLMDGRRSKALPFRPPGDGRRTPPLPGAAFLAPYEAKPRG